MVLARARSARAPGCAAEARTLGTGPASDLRVTGRALFPDSVESHGGIGEELTLGGGGTWEVVRLGGTAQAPPHETGGTRSNKINYLRISVNYYP